MKKCSACQQILDIAQYGANRSRRDGLQSECRACRVVMGKKMWRQRFDPQPRKPKTPKAPKKRPELDGVPKIAREVQSRRLLITCAVNATPVHQGFWASLETYARLKNAQILVVPIRYRNPTSRFPPEDERDDWWDADTMPHMVSYRTALNRNLVLAADVRVQPTASDPLSGFESLTRGESCLIAHPKIAFRSVPVPSGRLPKILTSTGACTLSNYTDSKAGALGDFHHVLGATLVELEDDGSTFYLRQINAQDDGSFIDWDTLYTPDGPQPAPPIEALVFGDVHARTMDHQVADSGLAVARELRAKHVVLHDVSDGQSMNPHERHNPFARLALDNKGRLDVASEVRTTLATIAHFAASATDGAVVVASNHTEFLDRWLYSHDWRSEPANAIFYLRTALAVAESAKLLPSGVPTYRPALDVWAAQDGTVSGSKFLGRDEPFVRAGVDLSNHGDKGPNGIRGSLKAFSKLGTRVIIGHSHSPGILNGAYQVGTTSHLKLGYNTGPSSWLNTHCILYANGKRTLITYVNGKYRLDDVN